MGRKAKNGATDRGTVVNLHVSGDGKVAENTADEEEIADIDALEDGQLSRAIDEVRNTEGAKAEVHRVLPADRAGFCRAYAVSVFSHERIAADYGPGKYRVRFKGPGDKYIPGGTTFSIAEGLTTTTAAAPGSSIADVLALFRAEREREKEAAEKKKGEWLEWAKLLAPLVAPKILDMLGGSKGPSIRDLVATMKDMKDLQAPAADLTAQFSQVMGILQGAKDLVGDGDGGKVGSTWVDLLRDFIQSPAAGALASAIPGLGPAPGTTLQNPSPSRASLAAPVSAAPQGPAGNSGSAPVTAPGSATGSSPDMLQQLQWLRGTLAQLLVQAAKRAPPRLYAEVVLDNLPPYVSPQQLLERLSAEGWFQQLQQVEPNVAAHAEWFERFRTIAVKLLRRRLRAAAEPEGPPHDPIGINQPMAEGEGSEFE
jgi:hypothetical protein